MKVGSAFSGIGGFDLGLEQAGMEVVWQIEADAWCNKILARHWPEVMRYGDITTVNPSQLERVDLICGGFPCQDLSVAGRRKGLAGSRSSLFWEFLRIADALRPRWLLIENVPGLLSSGDREDWPTLLDALASIGYAVDTDICDSQDFGVAQRRRRVFIVCQRAAIIRQMKTPTSLSTISQLLSEILLGLLVETSAASSTGYSDSTLPRWSSGGGLQKRMDLFRLRTEEHWNSLLADWDATSRLSLSEPQNSESRFAEPQKNAFSTDTPLYAASGTATEPLSGDIYKSWSKAWAVVSNMGNPSTTWTETSETTHSIIYGCALAAAAIFERTVRLKSSFPDSWKAEWSTLTALRGYTNYARQATESLFRDLRWVSDWWTFRRQTEYLYGLGSHLGAPCPPEVLFEPAGGAGDSPAGLGAGADLAASVTRSAGHHGWSSPRGDGSDNLVAHALRRDPGGIGQGWNTSCAVVNARQNPISIEGQSLPLDVGHPQHAVAYRVHAAESGALQAIGDTPDQFQAVAFAQNQRTDDFRGDYQGDYFTTPDGIAQTIPAGGGNVAGGSGTIVSYAPDRSGPHTALDTAAGDGNDDRVVAVVGTPADPDGVRKTTGLPRRMDPDGPRYRGLGNAVTVPVIRWIGERILKANAEA